MAKIDLPPTNRIEAFSDGVIAIVLTIMVLELKIPNHIPEGTDLWHGLILPQFSKFAAYVLSFVMIAIIWVNHHQLMQATRYATRPVLWFNNHLLFWISLIPFATAWAGGDFRSPYAIASYGLVLCLSMGAWALLRRHVMKVERVSRVLKATHRRAYLKSVWSLALYLLSVPLAFVSVYISIAIFVLVAALFFWPEPVKKSV